MTPQEWLRHLTVPSEQSVHLSSLLSPALEAIKTTLMKQGLMVAELDGSTMTGEAALFDAMARAFHFPDYFGKNWDALDECLRDLEWLPAPGYVLFLKEAGQLWQRAPKVVVDLVQCIFFVSAEWDKESIPFHLVMADRDVVTAQDLDTKAHRLCVH